MLLQRAGRIAGLVACALALACAAESDSREPPPEDGVAVEPAEPGGVDSPAAPAGDLAEAAALRPDGIGDIDVGISLADAIDRAGTAAVDPEPAEECRYITFPTLPEGVSFMVVRDTIRRVDVDTQEVRTERGAGIGMASGQVEQLHGGSAERMPHKYEPDGEYLIIAGATANTRLVFETAVDTVRTMRAGLMPEVLWVERCG